MKYKINGIGFPLFGHQMGRDLQQKDNDTFELVKSNGQRVEIQKNEFDEIREAVERVWTISGSLSNDEKRLWEQWKRGIPVNLKGKVSPTFRQFEVDVENCDKLYRELIDKYDPLTSTEE